MFFGGGAQKKGPACLRGEVYEKAQTTAPLHAAFVNFAGVIFQRPLKRERALTQ